MPKDGDTGARISSDGLSIEFVWRGDRFDHAVSSLAMKIATADAPGLATPVFQEVHPQGDVAFASGMDADRHWSASVEAIPGGFLFDIACRLKEPPEALGSAYREWDLKRVQLVGKPADGVPPPTIHTQSGVVAVRATRPDEGSPITVRYRYAIISADAQWIERER
ncbi:MAG: hypothetical protein AAF805_03450 [Planctomycetota bacterium]